MQTEQTVQIPGCNSSEGDSYGALEGCQLTFTVRLDRLPFRRSLQADRDAQELQVAIPVPDQQLLAGRDLFAALVEYLPLALQGRQVLLLGEAGAVH